MAIGVLVFLLTAPYLVQYKIIYGKVKKKKQFVRILLYKTKTTIYKLFCKYINLKIIVLGIFRKQLIFSSIKWQFFKKCFGFPAHAFFLITHKLHSHQVNYTITQNHSRNFFTLKSGNYFLKSLAFLLYIENY